MAQALLVRREIAVPETNNEEPIALRTMIGRRTMSNRNLMEYKGYIGKIEYDDEARIFYGEVINLRDVITFQGESVEELHQALEDSIEDYLEFCAERNEKPEKPFSGRILLRLDPELHRLLSERAQIEDTSINQLVTETLEKVIA